MSKTLRASDLAHFTGSETWWRHALNPSITYTDGARHIAEAGEAYWLLDAIVSHQCDPHVSAQPFQVWKLVVLEDRSAVLSCEDGNATLIARQMIPYTDFPLDVVELWLQNGVIFLPSEY